MIRMPKLQDCRLTARYIVVKLISKAEMTYFDWIQMVTLEAYIR